MALSKTANSISHYLTYCPFSLMIRETCRIHAIRPYLESLDENSKILDVGCGDGNWWKLHLESKHLLVDGVDVSESEIEKARKVINAKLLDITHSHRLKELRSDYDMIIGNCSLEHIPDINTALQNINHLLDEKSIFILFVPTPYWALKGKSVQLMNAVSPRLSMMFSGMINGFFQHWHLYHYALWSHLLNSNGFQVQKIQGIGSAKLEFLYRLFLPTAFISFLFKSVSGKYLNQLVSPFLPRSINARISTMVTADIENCVTSSDDENAFEYMIVARKK